MRHKGVLLIHGLTGSPHEMRPLDKALRNAGYQTRLVTLPGHGDRPAKRFQETSALEILDHCAAEYEQFSRETDQVYIVGHSLGGICTLLTASVQPPRLEGVVVFSAPYEHAYFYNYLHGFMNLPISNIIQGFCYDTEQGRQCKFIRPDCKPWNIPKLISQSRIMFSLMREQVHNINVPVSLVHSAYDLTIPYAEMQKLAHRIGKPERIRMTTLTRSGHRIFPSSKDVDEAVRVVLRFVGEDCDRLAQKPGTFATAS
jgi:carboxylesterase